MLSMLLMLSESATFMLFMLSMLLVLFMLLVLVMLRFVFSFQFSGEFCPYPSHDGNRRGPPPPERGR